MESYVTFLIRGEEYALALADVKEVLRAVAITKIPESLPFVKGVINLRGHVTPVIDLQHLFTQQPAPYTPDSHLIIARHHDYLLALVVDEVKDVITIAPRFLQQPQQTIPISEFLRSVVQMDEHLILIADLARIIQSTRLSYVQKLDSENSLLAARNK